MIVLELKDTGEDKYLQYSNTKILGRMYDDNSEQIKVIIPTSESESVCTMLVSTQDGTPIGAINVNSNGLVNIGNSLSQYPCCKIGFSFYRSDGSTKNSEICTYTFLKALKPEGFAPIPINPPVPPFLNNYLKKENVYTGAWFSNFSDNIVTINDELEIKNTNFVGIKPQINDECFGIIQYNAGFCYVTAKINEIGDIITKITITSLVNNKIPSKVSELDNDEGYLTEHQSLDGYATEDFVNDKIAQTTGQSTTEVMSQKAVTDELNKKANKTDIDKYFAALLNDTNTTETFKAWYNATNDGEVTRYALLERFFRMLALNNDQTHTVRFFSSAVSSDSKGTPLDWLADKKAQVLATDAGVVENANSWLDADGVTRNDGEDWATENRITWYVRANALSLDDGTMEVLAIEGVDDTFDITGNLAPVYSFQLSPWYKETDDGEYLIKSWRANYAEGYAPFNNNVDFDGNPRALTWHASFGGVMTDDGTKLTSGAYRRPKNYTSASTG